MRKLLFLLTLLALMACQSESRKEKYPTTAELMTPSGNVIKTTLAITMSVQTQGLSGMKASDFADDQGMLFFYLQDDERHFWMPDTYFDLDLFFLDKDLKIIDIIRKLPHHIGRANEHLIPRARGVWCRHTLEMKSGSPIANELKLGDQLTWKGEMSVAEVEEVIRRDNLQVH